MCYPNLVLCLLSFVSVAGQSEAAWNPPIYGPSEIANRVMKVTRYYTPEEDQPRYYNEWKQNPGICAVSNLSYVGYGDRRTGSYSAEVCMNGQGNKYITADGTDLRFVGPLTVAACPREMLGQTLIIEKVGRVVCRDTGGSVVGNTIDLWAGLGEEGYETIHYAPGGNLRVWFVE